MSLSPHLPDVSALALLVEVARLGSIGAAARAQGTTQQAASERLRSLETQVGFSVLQRGPRGSTLTASGTVLVGWASRLLEVAEEVDGAISTLRDDSGRELHVAASMTIAEHLVPRWLVLLRQRQVREGVTPTTVSLQAANSRAVVEAVVDGRADVGFVEGSATPRSLASLDLGGDELVLVVGPTSPLAAARRPLSPHQVAELVLTSREPGSGTRDVVEQALAGHGLSMAPPEAELTTSSAVRSSVRAGGAPAFLSSLVVEGDLATGDLVVVATEGLDLRRTFRAVWNGRAAPPAGPVRELLGLATVGS
ncbi:LysR family transcriptional regulator [Aeromicrobium endophyticum]|uniref:LysR family transcriptional regulator n=1 Tax=Aeromicrobium endophyticum TaxID=2292704 RepID=UPI001F3857D1|nr:LysR family transcriptional regulator [Aeromicrobium endophyticum]